MAKSLVELENGELSIENMSWPLDEIRVALLESLFNNISNEIILHIFRLLSVRNLCKISLVC